MKHFFILVSLIFAVFNLNAQTALPPVFELKADTVGEYSITEKYLQFFWETDQKFSLNQVLNKPFITHIEMDPSHEYVKRQWFRYRIKNHFNHDILIYFDAKSDNDEHYYKGQDAKWHHNVTGTEVAWSKKTGFKRFNCYYISIKANEEYIFYQRSTVKAFDIQVNKPRLGFMIKKNITDETAKNYELTIKSTQIEGFMLGFTILAAVFSFLFFYFSREKVYLYFSLAITTFLSAAARNILKDLFFIEIPEFSSNLNNYLFPFFFYFLWLFLSNFYKTKQYFATWTRITTLIAYWPFIFCLVLFFSNPYFINKDISNIINQIFPLIPILFLLNIIVIIFASILKNKAELYFNNLLIAPLFMSALLVPISLYIKIIM